MALLAYSRPMGKLNAPLGNILAVDDMPANLIALEAVFSGEYNVIPAGSGAEALTILKSRQDIDVILMDIQMPAMDGFDTAALVKKIEGCQDIPIIFITAIYREDPFIKRGYEVGGIDYFSKPFDPEILKLKVGIYASFRQKAAVLKERERQIRLSEELLRAGQKLSSVLESLPVGVIIADSMGRICQTNEQVTRIWKTVKPMDSDSYGDIMGWWDSDGQMIKEKGGPLYRALHDGEDSHNVALQIRCFDGSSKQILASASPLRALDGQIVGAVVLIQDFTEPKKIQHDLEVRVNKLVSLGMELEHISHS